MCTCSDNRYMGKRELGFQAQYFLFFMIFNNLVKTFSFYRFMNSSIYEDRELGLDL